MLPINIHIRIINEATGVDFITETSGKRISYAIFQNEHKIALIKPNTEIRALKAIEKAEMRAFYLFHAHTPPCRHVFA